MGEREVILALKNVTMEKVVKFLRQKMGNFKTVGHSLKLIFPPLKTGNAFNMPKYNSRLLNPKT